MSPMPRFHPTDRSARARPTETLIPPPKKLVNLTIGFKLSFVLIYPQYHLVDGDIEETAKNIIRNALVTTRFTEECELCPRDHTYNLPLSLNDPDRAAPDYQHWTVNTDFNAHLLDKDFEAINSRYFVVGIQITSRTFNYNVDTPCPDDVSDVAGKLLHHNHHHHLAAHNWRTELNAMDTALMNLSTKPNYRVITNEFTDFRVFVGNGPHGIHLNIAKHLLALFTGFERQFDTINPASRIGGGVRGEKYTIAGKLRVYRYQSEDQSVVQQEAGVSCRPMSAMNMSYLQLAQTDTEYDAQSFFRIFLKKELDRVHLQRLIDNDLISHVNSIIDISHIWDEKLIGYNPTYVAHCMKNPTIQFRSQAGTLDYEEQAHWISLCCSLVEYGYRRHSKYTSKWLTKRWHQPHDEYRIFDILEHIPTLPRSTLLYYRDCSSLVTRPNTKDVPPHLVRIANAQAAEKAHSDPLKSSGVPLSITARLWDDRKAENVRDKIKQKFELGLYGRFPVETVVEFCRTNGEKIGYLKGNYRHLILTTEKRHEGVCGKFGLQKDGR